MAEAADRTGQVRNAPESALPDGQGVLFGFLVKRLGSRPEAEDVLQEFCNRVLARREQLRDVDRTDAWHCATLRSALNDQYRKSARRGRLAEAVACELEASLRTIAQPTLTVVAGRALR
jgi:RNA polymerase sigma-70 factor (ECF subfamily)